MNRFKNLSTRTKLMVNIGLFVLIMIITTGLSIKEMGELSQRIEVIYKTNVLPMAILGDLRDNTQQVTGAVGLHILAHDSATAAKRIEEIARLDAEIETLVSSYEPIILSEPERKYFEQFQANWSGYKDIRAKVLQLSKDYSKDGASELREKELNPKIDALNDAVNGLVGENKTQAREAFQSSQDLRDTLTLTLILFVVGGCVVGIGFGWFMSRCIVANLLDVLEAAQQLGSGKLDARSTVTTLDEVGRLAQEFNRMGEALEHSMVKQQEAIEEMNARIDIMNTTSIVSEANLKGEILTANDKFIEISKYSKDEMIGRPHNLTRHPDVPKEVFKQMWQTIGAGKIFRGVIKNRAKDGTPYYVDAVIKPIMGPDGKPRKYLGVRYDITEHEIARQNMKGILDAINKSYATVEFDLNGTVQTANTLFLEKMGYSLGDIKGKHHSLFVEPSHSNTPEYRSLWEKIGRGEPDARQHKCIAKGGREIWFQTSYNPIYDEVGRPFKVLELATDITEQKQALVEVETLINAAAMGQLSPRIKVEMFTGASRDLTDSVNRLMEAVTHPLHEAQGVLTALAASDLTKSMTGAYQGEFEQMKNTLNLALTNLTKTITIVRDVVDSVSSGSEQITKGNEDLAQRTSEQAGSLEETSASMEEMTSTVKQNADNAKQANQLASAARETADKGGAVTKRAVDAMAEINKSSKKIADIITVIDEIAFQTNLLALNAAVEAARAGEHGRGFAVVAAEVRNLAQRSATAAKEIKGLINESIQRVTDGSELVDQSGKTLEEIVHSVKRVSDIIAEITVASQEQASGIDQVNKAIMAMDETTQQNAALVEETTSASQSMTEQAKELMRQVGVFKISRTETRTVSSSTPPVSSIRRNSQPETRNPKRETSGRAPHRSVEPAGVATGNGKDRRSSVDEFEEF